MIATITYQIRHANPDDIAACIDLRVKSEQALAAAGITQWHDREHGRQVITRWIEQGAMHVVTTLDGGVVGCFALAGADPDFWTPAEAVQPALYLYKFMIRADRRGTGLGEVILDWCAQRAAEVGARWLRLDCWRTNTALHQLWINRGFVRLDIREHPVRNSGALFQRDAGTVLAAPELRKSIELVDDTSSTLAAKAPLRTTEDRYDPTGEAAIWQEAAEIVNGMKLAEKPNSPDAWNTALDQASRSLENQGRAVRQAAGMYHRVITGNGD
jgi:GNAT superfamily N-acetyltransferase